MRTAARLVALAVVAGIAAGAPARADPAPTAPLPAPPRPPDPVPPYAVPPTASVRTPPPWRRDPLPRAWPTPGGDAKGSPLRDPQDGAFDVSGFLDEPYGFFPLVVPITEPAVGYGAAVVPIFVRRPEGGGRPDLMGAGAMATENGSQGAFAGFSKYSADQRFHVVGAALTASLNLDFYGLGSSLGVGGDAVRYELDVSAAIVGADVRIRDSHWRTGLRAAYAEFDASLPRQRDRDRAPILDFPDRFGGDGLGATVASLQGTLLYDTRDNVFTPLSGVYSELSLLVNSEALGATDDFQLLRWTTFLYRPLVPERLFLGVKADVAQSFSDPPFYLRPFVSLRGAPALRWQGEGVLSGEVEGRWQLSDRWSVVGFGGFGWTWTGEGRFEGSDTTLTGGAGVRYLVARRHGIHVGLDVATGEEGLAVYVQFGTAWFRP